MPKPSPLVLAALVLGACATPIAPTGGPTDETPPTLVEALPADGATNVSEPTVRLTFSERLAPSAAQAVTVTPEADAPPEVAVEGRDLTVTLPALRDSTTYVVTLGTELADQRNVRLRQPITVAFATGDAIDRGRIAGAVRRPDDGAPAPGLAVWAYALPDSASRPPDVRAVAPDYRTETGADGAFRLDYLRPGPYFVAAVADRNRNGRADAGEAFAAPPRAALAAADSSLSLPTFWVTTRDSIPPEAQRVRALSDRRLAVRFSEPVRLLDAAGLDVAVTDSATGARVEVTPYQPPASTFEVLLEASRPLGPAPHVVTLAPSSPPALADSAGLAPTAARLTVTPPARADTVEARFAGFLPVEADSAGVLRPGERPGVRFTSPPGALLEALALVAEEAPRDVPLVTDDGVTFRPDTSAALPQRFALSLTTSDSTYTRTYVVPDARDLGGIAGRVEGGERVVVELRPEAGPAVTVEAGPDGAFVAGGLLPGPYTLRVWDDRDGDGRWTGGALAPYAPPEPLRVLADPVTVRARWETEIDPIQL